MLNRVSRRTEDYRHLCPHQVEFVRRTQAHARAPLTASTYLIFLLFIKHRIYRNAYVIRFIYTGMRRISLNLGVVSDGELLQFLGSLAQHAVRDAVEDVDQHTCVNKHTVIIINQLAHTQESGVGGKGWERNILWLSVGRPDWGGCQLCQPQHVQGQRVQRGDLSATFIKPRAQYSRQPMAILYVLRLTTVCLFHYVPSC